MKTLCANCGERPASFIRRKIGLKVKHDKDHNLCRQCFESIEGFIGGSAEESNLSAGPALRLELRQEPEPVHERRCIYRNCERTIPEPRLRRGSLFCSQECYSQDHKERRAYLALQKCRKCGRGLPKPKKLKLDTVRQAHQPLESLTQ